MVLIYHYSTIKVEVVSVPFTDLNQCFWQENTMSFYKTCVLPNETDIKLVVRDVTEKRLSGTCFCGQDVGFAGNFSRWASVRNLLGDPIVTRELLADLYERCLTKDLGTHSIEIDYHSMVGWSSTAPRGDYRAEDLEPFQPNRRSVALRVKSDTGFLAPRTSKLTIVFEFKFECRLPVAVIHSIYPGKDVGELSGDVTEREGVVFFDWSHPGA